MSPAKRGSLGIILMLALTVSGLAWGLPGYDAGTDQGLPGTRSRQVSGPMTYINETTVIENQTWRIEDNITVTGGAELILKNSTMEFYSFDSFRFLYIEAGARFTMVNSETTTAPFKGQVRFYGYFIYLLGEFEMDNSTVSYCGYSQRIDEIMLTSTGLVIATSRAVITNSTFEFNDGAEVVNSSLHIDNTSFIYNSRAVMLYGSDVKFNNCTFDGNQRAITLEDSEYVIENCSFKYSMFSSGWKIGISLHESEGYIESCSFQGFDRAISIYDTTEAEQYLKPPDYDYIYYISNCTFGHLGTNNNGYGNVGYANGIYVGFARAELYDLTFNFTSDPYYYIAYTEYGLHFESAMVDIDRVYMNNCYTAMYIAESMVTVKNSVITDSNTGIYLLDYLDTESYFTADNISIINTLYGVVAGYADVTIKNSIIDKSRIAVDNYFSQMTLEDNVIVNSTDWGAISKGTEINLKGDNFPIPTTWPSDKPTNGNGNLAQLRHIDVYVMSTDDRPLAHFDVNVSSKDIGYIKETEGIFFDYNTKTDAAGFANIGDFFEYIIKRGNERTFVEEYTVTASYSTVEEFVFSNTTIVKLEDIVNDTLVLRVELPNVYLLENELVLSPSSVEPGERLTVTAMVHYTGPDDLEIPSFSASLYISTKLVDQVTVEGLSAADPEKELVFIWKAETGVPMPKAITKRTVEVRLEVPEGMEYQYGTTEFTDDNSVKSSVTIDLEEDRGPVRFTGDVSDILWFCCPLIIALVMIMAGVRILYIRSLPPEKREELLKKREEKKKLKKKVMLERRKSRSELIKERSKRKAGLDSRTERRIEEISAVIEEERRRGREEESTQQEEGESGREEESSSELPIASTDDDAEPRAPGPAEEDAGYPVPEEGAPVAEDETEGTGTIPPPELALDSPESTAKMKRRKRQRH